MTTIRLAVLDMAGTTVRDDGVVAHAFLAALASVGHGPDDAEHAARVAHVQATMGQSKIEVFRAMFPGDEHKARSANRAFEAAVDTYVREQGAAPIDGAADALAELRDGGVKVCLTTGFSAPTQAALVAHLGWGDRVDLTLAPGPGRRGRPHPDLVLAAVMALEIDDVREVAVAGDTANDLLSGHRAGASIVAGVLTGSHDRSQLEAAPHTHILDSVADLPAVVLAAR